jgi:hypothetical protein
LGIVEGRASFDDPHGLHLPYVHGRTAIWT